MRCRKEEIVITCYDIIKISSCSYIEWTAAAKAKKNMKEKEGKKLTIILLKHKLHFKWHLKVPSSFAVHKFTITWMPFPLSAFVCCLIRKCWEFKRRVSFHIFFCECVKIQYRVNFKVQYCRMCGWCEHFLSLLLTICMYGTYFYYKQY